MADSQKEEAEAPAEPEAPQEPEQPKEGEEDAVSDSREKVDASSVLPNLSEATLNVLPSMNDKLLMSLTDGGFQYLLAGVRCTAGVKSGRYMFEVKIIEQLNPSEPQGTKSISPKQLVRVGLTLDKSSVFQADSPDYCCFDSEGFFSYAKKRSKAGQKFTFADTVSVLLNLDGSSPNANTVSLFKNGVRASSPQALPDSLKGKTLYPTVTYKNVTLQVNFGPKPLVPLPFTCRMLKEAAAADVEVVTQPQPKDGVHEVLFPVGMPDEGVFDWADQFIEKNPTYTEISDRKIIEWVTKSGILRPKTTKGSNDSPDMNFGIPLLDDLSVRKLLSVIAPTLSRSFLVMELKANLIPEERKVALTRFGAFKKIGIVAMGEPSDDYKAWVHASMLADKEAKAEEVRKKKAQEKERARALEEKKKKAEEAKKAKLEKERKAKEAKEGKETKAEDAEEAKAEEEVEEKKEDEKMEEPEPPVELTEEEKKAWHRKQAIKDLSEAVLNSSYASFALPSASEGFDEVRYVWQKEEECANILTTWVRDRKMTQRVDDLEPGDWFKGQWSTWTKTLSDWKKKQTEWKDPAKKKALLAKKKEAKKKAAAEAQAEGGEAEVEEEPMEINAEDIDVFGVEDVTDIGSGEPLFANFSYEDWTLLSLRVEFHLLLHAWKKDLNDPERPSFKENHMPFYYNKYIKKQFNLKTYGVEQLTNFLEWIKEAVVVNKTTGFFEAQLDDDLPFAEFMKFAEEHRRDRQRRVDAGDEGALLKFQRAAAAPANPAKAPSAPGAPKAGIVGVKRPYGSIGAASPAAPKAARTGYVAQPSAAGRVGGYAGGTIRPAFGASPYSASPYGAPQRAAFGAPGAAPRGGVYGGGLYRRV